MAGLKKIFICYKIESETEQEEEMKTVEIKKSAFLEDRESMTVAEVKRKYDLNNAAYYRILDQLGIEKKEFSDRKKIVLVD